MISERIGRETNSWEDSFDLDPDVSAEFINEENKELANEIYKSPRTPVETKLYLKMKWGFAH